MRLIDVETLELKEFVDDNIPPYAILSHTWGQEEVSFQDLCWLNDYEYQRLAPTSLPALLSRTQRWRRNKATAIYRRVGFEKIVQSARLAEEKRLRYVWVDTCCIDKSSSSELSEAVNSMFHWYKKSTVCFVFLSDVRSRARRRRFFENSRWFTRGWTLQELIAPRELLFYDKYWVFIGSRTSLTTKIQEMTGIPIEDLEERPLDSFALAVRLGWARKRNTSRKEDMAYCLMGIFSINMPLIYGEGANAFIRLQQEIIREHRGQSLFAWGYNESLLIRSAIFAPSPSYFGSLDMRDGGIDGGPFHLNNIGLEISLLTFRLPNSSIGSTRHEYDIHYAIWDVQAWPPHLGIWERYPPRHRFCIPLFVASTDRKVIDDGQEMMLPPSRPVVININHVPKGTARRRILISEPLKYLVITGNDVHIRLDNLPSAKLVEVFPPAAEIRINKASPGATGMLHLCIGKRHHYGTHIFRFLVPGNTKNTDMKGNRPKHFAVILGPYSAATKATLESSGPEAIVSTIEWMDHSKSPDARKDEKAKEKTKQFWSLIDAFIAGVPLLDAKMWFDKPAPFFVNGRPLLATTTLDSNAHLGAPITKIGFTLGSNSRVDANNH